MPLGPGPGPGLDLGLRAALRAPGPALQLLRLNELGLSLGHNVSVVGMGRLVLGLELPSPSLQARLEEGVGQCRQEDGVPRLHGGRGEPREGLGRRGHVAGLTSGQTAPRRAHGGAPIGVRPPLGAVKVDCASAQ